jgi:ribonucleoside-diphosphate reductase alpha chain
MFRIWARRLPGCTGVQYRFDERSNQLQKIEGYEDSAYLMVDRVVREIGIHGVKVGYFDVAQQPLFYAELRSLFLNQYGLLNTPAWINIGVAPNPQASACFILDVQDSLKSIRHWWDTETVVFSSGSGAGVDLSGLRPENWPLSGGGCASGPVSFARGSDGLAGVVKSGGKSRRAAKMLTLHISHPDVKKFIAAKRGAQRRAHALIDSGLPGNWQSDTWQHEPFQNSNLSVRVDDEFMEAVENDEPYALKFGGEVVETIRARDLWDLICECAWESGDPGIQFETTINKWHTVPGLGPIVSSNPCSEFLHPNNTACNLASLNLLKVVNPDGSFNIPLFKHCVRLLIIAQDIICDFAGYPTKEIADNSANYRPLGLGYCNLGALLMRQGIGYDSDEGRSLAASITALMGGEAYKVSGEIAKLLGPFKGFEANANVMRAVVEAHANACQPLAQDELGNAACIAWEEAERCGQWRNSQVTLLAPTGTIGIVMDADTTGLEPEYDLVTYKTLASGGVTRKVSGSVRGALEKLGWQPELIQGTLRDLERDGEINPVVMAAWPQLRHVLSTAAGQWPLSPAAHIRTMAAVQPFLSGGISKTVNLPSSAQVGDVQDAYALAWKLGVKCVALYRDGCKRSQPLNSGTSAEPEKANPTVPSGRRHLPDDRQASTHKLTLGGHDLYLTLGYYPDSTIGEMFVRMAKSGETESAMVEALGQAVSIGLQYGVPLACYLDKWIGTRFAPSGWTGKEDIRSASSPLDLIAKKIQKLGAKEIPRAFEERRAQISAMLEQGEREIAEGRTYDFDEVMAELELSPCCGATYRSTGTCKTCSNCGATSSGCG